MMMLHTSRSRSRVLNWLAVFVLGLVALAVWWWWPVLSGWVDQTLAATHTTPAMSHGHGHAGEEGDHAGHDHAPAAAPETLTLTPQARKNLGLTSEFLQPVELSTYRRSLSVPAIVVSRPGRTQIQVSTPLTGVVTHVHAVTGEAVTPGTLLFEIRLTHEDLVNSQTEFLQTLGELEVENREIARLEEVANTGAVPIKTVLERRYAKEKLEALLAAQREALKLHGLSDRQIDAIVSERHLLRDLSINAPEIDQHQHDNDELKLSSRLVSVSLTNHAGHETPLVMEELMVHKGQSVIAGQQLCALADYSQLYLEGQAFEQDSAIITRASEQGWPISAHLPSDGGDWQTLKDLQLAYVGNAVDAQSRTLSFYVELPNEILRDQTTAEGQRYLSWRYRPGQRMQVSVPIEQWDNQIVLPVDAVVKEGADWFVFRQNSKQFERVAVHVKYRDQEHAVVEYDGTLFPGDVVAMRSAHQMQMAIRNQSGGAVDPHAGHNH